MGASSAWSQTTASWLAPVSGTWTDATKWSTNPDYPNNGTPSGSTYNANITAIGSPYTITNGTSLSLQQLSLASPNATLQLNGGTIALGSLSIDSGTLVMAGGSIHGANLSVSDSAVLRWTGNTGTLAASSLAGKVKVESGRMRIGGGLTMNGSFIELAGSSSFAFTGNQTISGTGSILANGSGFTQEVSVTTITFDSGISLITGSSGISLTTNLTNKGLISSRTPKRGITMGVNSANNGTLNNEGTIEVINGGSFAFGGFFNNTGTIIINNGSFHVQRKSTTGPLITNFGNILRTGGTVSIGSVLLDNTGATLTLGQGIAPTFMEHSEIRGGTLVGSPGESLTLMGSTLNGVRIGGEVNGTFYWSPSMGTFSSIKGGLQFLPGGRLNLNAEAGLTDAGSISG